VGNHAETLSTCPKQYKRVGQIKARSASTGPGRQGFGATIDYVKGQSVVVRQGFPKGGNERVEPLFLSTCVQWYPPVTVGSAVKVAYFLSQYGGSMRAILGYSSPYRRALLARFCAPSLALVFAVGFISSSEVEWLFYICRRQGFYPYSGSPRLVGLMREKHREQQGLQHPVQA